MATGQKWYETWWGILHVLAFIEHNPRRIKTFMEVNKEFEEDDNDGSNPIRRPQA